MAKCIAPAMSAETRGRVGGIVFGTWRGIRTIRVKTSPAQPRSKLQLSTRAFLTQMIRAWQTITQLQRDAWDAYAADHKVTDWTRTAVRATGANWFAALGARMLSVGLVPVNNPPSVPAPNGLALFAAANGAGSSVLTWTPTAGTDQLAQIYMVGPVSAGVRASIRKARFNLQVTGESGTVTITGLRPGTYTFFARAMLEANGLVSPFVSDPATIT
jgi:hypothetical protein